MKKENEKTKNLRKKTKEHEHEVQAVLCSCNNLSLNVIENPYYYYCQSNQLFDARSIVFIGF